MPRGIAWVIGNGGSAATASHFANDLFKMGRLRAVPLADLTPLSTAYGNDHGWKSMYADPLKGLMGREDVLIAISCSGVFPEHRGSGTGSGERADRPDRETSQHEHLGRTAGA